jgi:hypothetical protein
LRLALILGLQTIHLDLENIQSPNSKFLVSWIVIFKLEKNSKKKKFPTKATGVAVIAVRYLPLAYIISVSKMPPKATKGEYIETVWLPCICQGSFCGLTWTIDFYFNPALTYINLYTGYREQNISKIAYPRHTTHYSGW